MSLKSNSIPGIQRALVLQGGGALGAYEVGALRILCDKLIEDDENSKREGPLFDIIAGSSIGAMNAAVLVSNAVNRNKTWKEAVMELENFWTDEDQGLSSTPNCSDWWCNDGDDKNMVGASDEARRKYYSTKEYQTHGIPHVCSAPYVLGADKKFGDQQTNLRYHHSSEPLEQTIARYSTGQTNHKKLRIFTSREKGQPRLLVTSVRVRDGKVVTFDSYHRKADDPKHTIMLK